MTALATNRNTAHRPGLETGHPLAAATRVFGGGMVSLNATGFAKPAAVNLGSVRGVAQDTVDNRLGVDGDQRVLVKRGCFCLANSAGADLITRADIGSTCFAADDQTVAKLNTGGRPVAGVIEDVDADGVWVRI